MSEPQQPPVPPSAQPNPASPPAPPAAHLPAAPQYPSQPQGFPPAQPQGYPAGQPQSYQPQSYQPQYPVQPHASGQPPYGQKPYGQQPHGPSRPSGTGNSLARTAFIVALVVAADGALQILSQPFVLASFGYDAGNWEVFSFVFAVILFLGSAAALVLGLIAARRPGGHLLAGIAIGVGGIQLIGIVLGWISSLFYRFF